jgi:hypothetical protein
MRIATMRGISGIAFLLLSIGVLKAQTVSQRATAQSVDRLTLERVTAENATVPAIGKALIALPTPEVQPLARPHLFATVGAQASEEPVVLQFLQVLAYCAYEVEQGTFESIGACYAYIFIGLT